jgi:GAF domain-containing protein
MQSELGEPLLVGQTVIGVLNVEDPAPGAFALEDERLLQLLAGYAAMALAGEGGPAE